MFVVVNLTITLTVSGTICYSTLPSLSLSGLLRILENSLHQEASWTAQDPLWLCRSVLSLAHGHHARLREGEAINITSD